MGTNNLDTVSAGVIKTSHPNQFKTALTEDVVPRSASGVPTDVAGSLGSTIYRWLSGYFSKIYLGTTANNNSIEESGTAVIIKHSGTEKFKVDSTGVYRKYFGAVNSNVANMSAIHTITSSTYTDVTGLSVSITTNGNPVMISIQPKVGSTQACIDSYASGSSVSYGYFRFLRGATSIGEAYVGVGATGATNTQVIFPGMYQIVDDNNGAGLAAGTYTYKIQGKVSVGTHIAFNDLMIKVIEI